MRTLRLALILTISLLTVGLQAAPGPYVLCVSKCEMAESGETFEMVCWSGPTESGCGVFKTSGCGGCEDVEIDISEFGCCVADASCPPFESCPQFPGTSDGNCPFGSPECFYCLPGRVLADKAPQNDQANDSGSDQISGLATAQLAIADFVRETSHSHSPPGPILADSGYDICIEICLLLI